jgi:hypothetical protein
MEGRRQLKLLVLLIHGRGHRFPLWIGGVTSVLGGRIGAVRSVVSSECQRCLCRLHANNGQWLIVGGQ